MKLIVDLYLFFVIHQFLYTIHVNNINSEIVSCQDIHDIPSPRVAVTPRQDDPVLPALHLSVPDCIDEAPLVTRVIGQVDYLDPGAERTQSVESALLYTVAKQDLSRM